MTGANLSLVFAAMSSVFAQEGQALVQWLIESYHQVYEALDITRAKAPLILRKLMGTGTVFGLVHVGGHVLSFESNGSGRIWTSDSLQFVRSFTTPARSVTAPIVHKGRLFLFDPSRPCFGSLAGLVSGQDAGFQELVLPKGAEVVAGVSVDEELWVSGDRLLVIGADMMAKEVLPPQAKERSVIKAVQRVGPNRSSILHLFNLR